MDDDSKRAWVQLIREDYVLCPPEHAKAQGRAMLGACVGVAGRDELRKCDAQEFRKSTAPQFLPYD
jgi:hypothetical protein